MTTKIFEWVIVAASVIYIVETLYWWFIRVKHKQIWFPYVAPKKGK
jgi:hypothetical protein